MPTDFEKRLRNALHAEAAEVRPDPATWARVQEGIRRRRTFRWLYAGLGAAAAAAIAAFALISLPALLYSDDPSRVEFADDLPSEAQQPTPTDDPTGAETAPGPDATGAEGVPSVGLSDGAYVTTDGERIVLRDDTGAEVRVLSEAGADGGGNGGGEEAISFRNVAVRPGSTTDDLTIAWRAGIDCGATLGWERFVDGEPVGGGDMPAVDCPGAPVFSPDGQHVAWTEGNRTDPSAFSLQTIDWTDDGPGNRDAGFGLQTPTELFLVDVTGWIWPPDADVEVGGYLSLRANTGDQEPRICTVAVDRQGDGALALPESGTLTCHEGIAEVGSSSYGGGVETPLYALRGSDGGVELVRATGQELDTVAVPATDSSQARWWLTAWGEAVIVGDGAGRAWTISYDDGWGAFQELPVGTVHAQPLNAVGSPAPDDTEPSTPASGGSGDLPVLVEGVPPAVADTATALYEAAVDRDWAQMEALLPEDGQFTSNYGGAEDHIGYYQQAEASGEDVFGALKAVLSLPSAEQGDLHVWPFAHVRDPNSLSSAELEQLGAHFPQEQIDSWMEAGSYLGWRVAIDEDGAWRYFVAGD